MQKKVKWSGERLETFIYSRDTIDHLHRYAIAAEYCKDKVVLDIASGEGYGSNLLSKQAEMVIGVDIAQNAVENAASKYKSANLQFLIGSTDAIPLNNCSVDVVVSFETIEHHDRHDIMFTEIKRVLKPNGILIISTPDKLYYSDLRSFSNEYHVKELYKKDFLDLISKYFTNVQLLTQTYLNGNSLINDENKTLGIKYYTGNYEAVAQTEMHHLYLVAIASDQHFLLQNTSIFEGTEITQIQQKNDKQKIYSSASYKIGATLLKPVVILRKFLR